MPVSELVQSHHNSNAAYRREREAKYLYIQRAYRRAPPCNRIQHTWPDASSRYLIQSLVEDADLAHELDENGTPCTCNQSCLPDRGKGKNDG